IVDAVEYADQQPWDTLADGHGPSLVLCNPDNDNSLPENWLVSAELAAINDDGEEIFATPGGPCVTTKINHNISESDILIYPNPNRGIFTLKAVSTENCRIEIFNFTGLKIYETNFLPSNLIDISEITTNGMYLIKITNQTTSQEFLTKIIIQK
ncbi:MAG: T9SS type A sorting domain-containing protein, partial [Bacteroidales bacterium]|nr:T9SS type A sorting domain-containing protein [Bacteroidales bacterium]